MSLENLNIKVKDVVTYCVYLFTLFAFVVNINNKVDKALESLKDLKQEGKEISAELINETGDCIDRETKELVTAQYMTANDKEAFLLDLFGYEKAPVQDL